MNMKRKKLFAIFTVAALAVGLIGCGSSAGTGTQTVQEAPGAGEETIEEIKETQPAVTAADADTQISFTGDSADIEGSGASTDGAVVTITAAGKYAVSGTVAGGQVIVDAGDDDTVTLILENADITNEDDAAIYIKNAKLAGIILADESDNRLQSGAEREIDFSAKNSSDEDASGAALRAKCDLEISGNGTIKVFGYINNGIQSSAGLTVNGGTIEVSAVHHGIKGDDFVTVNDGDITVTAKQDGIHSDDRVYIADGNITIASADDGIHADNELTIENGTVNITDSYEGLEADNVLIAGGIINVTSSEDGVNATDGESGGFGFGGGMDPGNFELPNGFEFPDDMESLMEQIQSGEFEFPEGFEFPGGRDGMERGDFGMPEGQNGMDRGDMQERMQNFAPGEDFDMQGGFGGNGMPGGFGSMQDIDKDSLPVIRITGGTLTVNAGGDGLDSNGNLYVEGGLVIVNGPVNGANGALDYGMENGGECLVTGGTVLAVGSTGMAETFGSDSTQCSFICDLDSSFDEGDKLTITAEDGTVLFEHEIIKKGSSVVFSSPDLNIGDTVTLSVGDESTEITLDSISTSAGGRGGFGGFGGFGGMGGFGDRDGMRQ